MEEFMRCCKHIKEIQQERFLFEGYENIMSSLRKKIMVISSRLYKEIEVVLGSVKKKYIQNKEWFQNLKIDIGL